MKITGTTFTRWSGIVAILVGFVTAAGIIPFLNEDLAPAFAAWGALMPTFEHTSFAISGSREIAAISGVGLHSRHQFSWLGYSPSWQGS